MVVSYAFLYKKMGYRFFKKDTLIGYSYIDAREYIAYLHGRCRFTSVKIWTPNGTFIVKLKKFNETAMVRYFVDENDYVTFIRKYLP